MRERWIWRCNYSNDAGSWKDSITCQERSRATFPSEAKAQAALDQHLRNTWHPLYSGRVRKSGSVMKLMKGQRWA